VITDVGKYVGSGVALLGGLVGSLVLLMAGRLEEDGGLLYFAQWTPPKTDALYHPSRHKGADMLFAVPEEIPSYDRSKICIVSMLFYYPCSGIVKVTDRNFSAEVA